MILAIALIPLTLLCQLVLCSSPCHLILGPIGAVHLVASRTEMSAKCSDIADDVAVTGPSYGLE